MQITTINVLFKKLNWATENIIEFTNKYQVLNKFKTNLQLSTFPTPLSHKSCHHRAHGLRRRPSSRFVRTGYFRPLCPARGNDHQTTSKCTPSWKLRPTSFRSLWSTRTGKMVVFSNIRVAIRTKQGKKIGYSNKILL